MVFSLKYHLVWCPKYRRKVLVAPVDNRLKELIAETAEEHGMTVHRMEVMPDHVHLFVEADPTLSVAEIVNRFKRRETVAFCDRSMLRYRVRACAGHCGAAVTTPDPVGAVSEGVVRRYIEAQKGA